MSFLKDLQPNIRRDGDKKAGEGTDALKVNVAASKTPQNPSNTPQTAPENEDEKTSMGPSVSPEDLQAAFNVRNPEQREYQSLAEARDAIAQEMGEEKAQPFGEYQRRIQGFIEEHDTARQSMKGKGKQVQLNFRIQEASRHYLKLVALENHVDVTTYVFGAINARLHAEGRTRYIR